jgi:hypothetical protein
MHQRDLDLGLDPSPLFVADILLSSFITGLLCLLEPICSPPSELLFSSSLDDEVILELLLLELEELDELELPERCLSISLFCISSFLRSFFDKNLYLYSSRSFHIMKPSRWFNSIALS